MSTHPIDERTRAFRQWINDILIKRNINQTELARLAGLSHSTLSRALSSDNYKINFRSDTIARIAAVGGIAPPMALAGSLHSSQGMKEPEILSFNGPIDFGPDEEDPLPTQTIWTANTNILSPIGIISGDYFILDQKVQPVSGDAIIIQEYDHQTGTAETMLRIYADGFAVTPLFLVEGSQKKWIDGSNITLMGVIVKSWRVRKHS